MIALGIITGTQIEARCWPRDPGMVVARSGADPVKAHKEAVRLLAGGARILVSFGLAGALEPELRAGDLVLADGVMLPAGQWVAADEDLTGQLDEACRAAGIRVWPGAIAGSDRLVATPDEKRRLGAATDARAVDMESHAVATAARNAGLPVVVLRAIADQLDQSIPSVARAALGHDGTISMWALARALARQPDQLLPLIQLGRVSRRGLRTLGRVAALAAPILARD